MLVLWGGLDWCIGDFFIGLLDFSSMDCCIGEFLLMYLFEVFKWIIVVREVFWVYWCNLGDFE